MAQFYLADGDNRKGPFPAEQLAAQGLTADTLVWREGMADWQPASAVAELRPYLPAQQPAQFQQPQFQQPQNQQQYQAYNANYGQNIGYATPTQSQGPTGMAIAGMVVGILGLLISWIPIIGLIIAVLGLIFSVVGMKSVAGKGMAIAGLVCACLGSVVGLIMTIALFAGLAGL